MVSKFLPIYEKLPSPSDSSFLPDFEFKPDKVVGRIPRDYADTEDPMAFCIQEGEAYMVCSPEAVKLHGFESEELYIIGFGTSIIDYECVIGTVGEVDQEHLRVLDYAETIKERVVSRRSIVRAAKVIRWVMVPKEETE